MNVQTDTIKPSTFRRFYRPLEPILEKPRTRIYTATVLSFLTVSLFAWYAIRPTIQTIISLRREIKDSTAVDEKMETKINALVEAQANYQAVSSRLEFLNEAIPETPEMIPLVKQIQNLANSVQATVSATEVSSIPLEPTPKVKAPTAKQNIITSPLSMTIEGTYDSMKQFIEGLYTMRRLVTISEISILPQNTGVEQNPSLIMTIKMNTYSLNQ